MRDGGFVVEDDEDGVVFVGDGWVVDVDQAVCGAGEELKLALGWRWVGVHVRGERGGNVEVQGGDGVGVRVGVAVQELGGGEVGVGPVGLARAACHVVP